MNQIEVINTAKAPAEVIESAKQYPHTATDFKVGTYNDEKGKQIFTFKFLRCDGNVNYFECLS